MIDAKTKEAFKEFNKIGSSRQRVILTPCIPDSQKSRLSVLLVSPLQFDSDSFNWSAPPIGLYRIKRYCETRIPDVNIDIWDSIIDGNKILDSYRGMKVDILGVSVLHFTLVNTIKFLREWKSQHPECLIVAGNYEAFENYEDVLNYTGTDICVLGEGERTFQQIIQWRLGELKLEDIDGIIYRKPQKVFAESDYWDFHKDLYFPGMKYQEHWDRIAKLYDDPPYRKIRYIRLHNLNFCNLGCRFCSITNTRQAITCRDNVKTCMLTGDHIFELVKKAKEQLPDLETVYFSDDNSLLYKDNFIRFADLYKKAKMNLRLLIQTHSSWLNEDIFPVLKSVGVEHITVGAENCSSRIRTALGKTQKDEQLEKIIALGKKHKIDIYYLIILIPPESTLYDLLLNLKTLKNWIEQGVALSIEPTVMAYKNTDYWNSDFDTMHEIIDLEDGRKIKNHLWYLPRDPAVREIAIKFMRQKDAFIREYFEKEYGHKHFYKGATSKPMVQLLENLLNQYLGSPEGKGVIW